MDLFLIFVIAMSVTIVLIPPLRRVAERLQVVDRPSSRKVHSHPVPRVGGVAMFIGTVLPLLVWLKLTPTLLAFLLGAGIVLAFGVTDDRFDLDYRIKVIGQLLAIGVVVIWGDVRIESVTLAAREPIAPWVSWPLTILFLLGVTNAINLADGLDGLAGGTTLLCLSAMGLIAFAGDNLLACAITVATVGAILGFLRFNTYPARIFMGDGGSQFLGFSAGVLSILVTQDAASPVSAALPLLLLCLPILDTLMVMTQRIAEGRSPFTADRNHIHHKLLALGFDHHEAVVAIYALQGALFVLAYLVRFESDLLLVGLFALCALLVVALLQGAHAAGWHRRRDRPAGHLSALSWRIRWLRAPERLPRWSFIFICMFVPAYCLFVIARASSVSQDLTWLAIGLLAVVAVTFPLAWRREPGWVEKGVAYVVAVLVTYLDQTTATTAHDLRGFVPFVPLALAVALRFRLSNDRRFQVTPLDVLVIFVALVIPNLPGSLALPEGLGVGVAKIIVLLYAIEAILAERLRWDAPRALIAAALVALVAKGTIAGA
jgi:UDP-GlcNAc:undecaprenyl-phosphate GlcNAc-1-phosphate transferase